ncbi:MAG: phospholipase D family protein [Rhodovulum sp.]
MQDRVALDPENRALYGEILRAPAGHELDLALATSYTLDFETALVVPATLAFHAAENRQQTLDTPLALLEGLERLSARIAIFCEAGRIKAVPKGANRLTALLEDTVTEVAAPRGGAFHPKLWLLRFVPVGRQGGARLRLAILSRNLTTDASWDLSLCLDGRPSDTRQAANAPLEGLVRALPDLAAGRPTPERNRAIAEALAADLETAVWERPEHVRDISFAVNGLDENVWRPRVGQTLGIVSPFVNDSALEQLTRGVAPQSAQLLSRGEELAQLKPETLDRFGRIMVLDELAETEDGEETPEEQDRRVPSRGLHAKAFITERHSSTEITIGSGNATGPALIGGENVEVFATLSGYSRHLGTMEDQLAPERLGRYLRDFTPFTPPDLSAETDGNRRLDAVRQALTRASLRLQCQEEDGMRIALSISADDEVRLPEGTDLRVWPLVSGAEHGVDLGHVGMHPQMLGRMALKDVTRWLGVRLRDEESGVEQVFSMGATLLGLPEVRTAEILRSIIENREAFLRYIRLLLGDVSEAARALFAARTGGDLSGVFGRGHGEPILEDMVRALAGDGRQLRDIERLVDRLGQSRDGRGDPVIPDDFLQLWETFREVLPDQEAQDG